MKSKNPPLQESTLKIYPPPSTASRTSEKLDLDKLTNLIFPGLYQNHMDKTDLKTSHIRTSQNAGFHQP